MSTIVGGGDVSGCSGSSGNLAVYIIFILIYNNSNNKIWIYSFF